MRMAVRSPAAGKQEKSARAAVDASDIVVWLKPLDPATRSEPEGTANPKKFQLVQHNKRFQPHVLVVPVGSVVDFPNHDPFFHNMFSLFDGKPFDLGLYEAGSTQFVQFDKPGISYIFCNIHPQMSAVVIALSTPYYAISNWRGEISSGDVVPGAWQMHVFHPSVAPDALQVAEREITVTPGDTFLGSFSLAESNLELAHNNKYGRDYDRPDPDSPAYARP